MPDTPESGMYSLGNSIYKENLICGHPMKHYIKVPGWVLDFSLDGTVEINGIELSPHMWRLSRSEKGYRSIKRKDDNTSGFLSIGIHENTYDKFDFESQKKEGRYTNLIIYPILKIISIIKDEDRGFENDLCLNCYIQLIISRLDAIHSVRCTFRFDELSRIFQAVTDLNRIEKFPSSSEILLQTGMKKSRFQKACIAIFDQPLQQIIQHLKMTWAYDAIIFERKEINQTSVALGYKHSPNFITAFHRHFSLTPMEAVRYQAG